MLITTGFLLFGHFIYLEGSIYTAYKTMLLGFLFFIKIFFQNKIFKIL